MKKIQLFVLIPLVTVLAAGHISCPDGETSVTTTVVGDGRTLNDFMVNPDIRYTQNDVNPGANPEGDYLGWPVFTKDGSRILLTNRATNNVTVFDWTTMAVLTNINVGSYPGGIAVSDSYAVVPCGFGDQVYVIRLSNYSIAHVFSLPAGQQPWVVRISPDGNRAYVACDISNTCEVFDLPTMTHIMTISNFPIALMTYSWYSENGRNAFTFTNFEVTNDGNYLVSSGYEDYLSFFNTATGNLDFTIPGVENCAAVGISGDGSKIVALSHVNPGIVYQVDNASHAITGTVTLTGYQLMTYEVGVNATGSKAYVGISNNRSAIVRFSTSDFVTFSNTYTAFWIGTSPSHNYAISGQYNFSIVDFNLETVLGQSIGNSQNYGAVSPIGNRVVGHYPYAHEGLYFYDYTTPTAPVYRGTTFSGLTPEGDAPRRVAIAPNGVKAVVTNVLSDNASIINLLTHNVEAILPISDRVQDVAITSDSRWAVVCGLNSNSAVILDLQSNTVAANVPTGTGASVVSIAPDDSFAYVGNMIANTISVIRLNGISSANIANIPCGEIGLVWACYGVSSDVKVDPTGSYVLVAVSFDDQVRIISTATNQVVAAVTVGDFPIQIDFDSTGRYATVTNYFSNNFSIIYVDGASSSLVGTYAAGSYPLRLDYNRTYDEIGIGNYNTKTIMNVDPRTGALHSTDSYASYGNLIQVLFDETGEPIALTTAIGSIPGHILRGSDVIPLPAVPAYFDYCPAVHKAAIAMAGPDYLTVIDWGVAGTREITNIPVLMINDDLVLEPNLVAEKTPLIIKSRSLDEERLSMIAVYDISGQLVKSLTGRSGDKMIWDGLDDRGRPLPAGVYIVVGQYGNRVRTGKITFVR